MQQNTTAETKNNILNPHHWVANYADYLYAYAITRLNDEEQARDLVQETFLAALEKLDRFEGRSSERTWLTAILKNKIIDIYRKRSSALTNVGYAERKAEWEQNEFFYDDYGHWKQEHWPAEFGIEHATALENKEFNAILQKCMQKLPALWLSVFTMKHMDDEATDVICKELRVTASNFWVIIHRAKVNLRACLQKHWL